MTSDADRLKDHEDRIRSLERQVGRWQGATAVLAVAVALFGARLVSLLSG